MLVMFAVGVANLILMGLTALMVHERTRPHGRDSVPATVALLAAAKIVLAYSAYAGGVV